MFNQPDYGSARILLAGNNFGCGSSREHAPWALAGWGIQAVISTCFADIFLNNAMKNGLLPVSVDANAQKKLFDLVNEDPSNEVTIDLEQQKLIFPDGTSAGFPIDAFDKLCLLEGVDQLGYLLNHDAQIKAYELKHAG